MTTRPTAVRTKGIHKSLGRGGYARITEVVLKTPRKRKTPPPPAPPRRQGGK
jgi:hypothetical protein